MWVCVCVCRLVTQGSLYMCLLLHFLFLWGRISPQRTWQRTVGGQMGLLWVCQYASVCAFPYQWEWKVMHTKRNQAHLLVIEPRIHPLALLPLPLLPPPPPQALLSCKWLSWARGVGGGGELEGWKEGTGYSLTGWVMASRDPRLAGSVQHEV